jgi:hypothetical protein
VPAAAPPRPADSRNAEVGHAGAAAPALAVGDAATLGVTVGVALADSVGDGDGDEVGEGEVVTGLGGDVRGALELPVHPPIATSEVSTQTGRSRRTRRA